MFINRPIFATVLALILVVAGLVTLHILPIAQYPEITPPTVQVSAFYPGADAETVAQTVGLPIEQQVNGVDGMLYMSSNSSSSGAYSLTITFAVGTDIDMATVMVQNRVSIAQSSLPEAVIVQGITTKKQSSNIVMSGGRGKTKVFNMRPLLCGKPSRYEKTLLPENRKERRWQLYALTVRFCRTEADPRRR